MTRRRLAFLAFAVFDLLLVAVLAGLWLMRSAMVEEQALSELGIARFDPPHTLNDFRLADQYGNDFTHADLAGRWHLVFFGFTSCPDICPLTMQGLEGFYRDLEQSARQQEVGVIMVSVDPLRDTPEVMADYLASYHPDFIGLTGDYPAISSLASQLFAAFSLPGEHDVGHGDQHDDGDYVVPHSDYIAVIDPRGQFRNIIHSPHRRESLARAFQAIIEDY